MNINKDKKNLFQSFFKDVIVYSSGQIILLGFGVIQTLILPKYLSITDYGYWQMFILFSSYVGILHLGFLDGLLVCWAGKDIVNIRSEIPIALKFFLIQQSILISFLLLITLLSNNIFPDILFFVLIYGFIINFSNFFSFLAQSSKQFKLVTVVNIVKGLFFLCFILFFLTFNCITYNNLMRATLLGGFCSLTIYLIFFREFFFKKGFNLHSFVTYGLKNIRIGIFILLGNFIVVIFMSIDRLMLGSFFSISQFAIYTFAISMCGIFFTFLQAISQVFFSYIAEQKHEIKKKIYLILKPSLLIFWGGILSGFFPLSAVINYYLPDYKTSLPVLAILLCTIGISGPILILHINFFKFYQKQRLYFIIAGVSLLIAIMLILITIQLYNTPESVAIATLISFSIWYLLNELFIRDVLILSQRDTIKSLFIIYCYAGSFLMLDKIITEWFEGLLFYFLIFLSITSIFLFKESKEFLNFIIVMIKKFSC